MATPNVYFNASSAAPAATGSTAGLMAGAGQVNSFTSRYGYPVLVTVTCNGAASAVAASGGSLQLYYGFGLPPAALASLTGTAIGQRATLLNGGTTAATAPFTLQAIIYGLAPGAGIWLDVAYFANGAGTFAPQNMTFVATELASGT